METKRIALEAVVMNGTEPTLAGLPLAIGSRVEVLIDGRWIAGTLEAENGLLAVSVPQGYGTFVPLLVSSGYIIRRLN